MEDCLNIEIYEGKLDENNKRKGKGIMRYNNGEIYNGEWDIDNKNREGLLILNEDLVSFSITPHLKALAISLLIE